MRAEPMATVDDFNQFGLLVMDAAVANDLGPEGCWLLMVVAGLQVRRGGGPVTMFNGASLPMLGCRNEAALRRIRARCVEAGWLIHEPGGSRRPPTYAVTIPDRHLDAEGQV